MSRGRVHTATSRSIGFGQAQEVTQKKIVAAKREGTIIAGDSWTTDFWGRAAHMAAKAMRRTKGLQPCEDEKRGPAEGSYVANVRKEKP